MIVFFSETEKGIFEEILKGHIDFESPPWPSISTGAKDLITKMLTYDPKKRITAAQAIGKYTKLKGLRRKYFTINDSGNSIICVVL